MPDAPIRFGEYFPPGYGKFQMRWDCVDTDFGAVCTFGFKNNPALTAAEATAELQPIWYNSGRPSGINVMSDQWTNVSTYCLLQHPAYQTSYESELNTTGTVTARSPSSANSLVVRKTTARAGKRYRGRFSWPPFLITEADVDSGGRIDNSELVVAQGRFEDALDGMTAAGLPMVLIHTRFTVDEEPFPTIVDELSAQVVMGVQRRRQRR